MTILFLGDIVAKIGRRAVARVLPTWQKTYKPDLVIANVENLAHGKGVTKKTLAEIADIGIEVFTSGNHIWANKDALTLLKDSSSALLRPQNYPKELPGSGLWRGTVKNKKVAVINIIGRGFMPGDYDCPFRAFDALWKKVKHDEIVLVDFHAETTSEKAAFALYVDGRATAVLGTHTHVPTADMRNLHEGTLFMTDVGMCGFRDGVIGVEKEGIIRSMLDQYRHKKVWAESGMSQVNGVLLKKTPQGIFVGKHLYKEVAIS